MSKVLVVPSEPQQEHSPSPSDQTQIVPIHSLNEHQTEEKEVDFTPEESERERRKSLSQVTRTKSTIAKAHALHSDFNNHERALKEKQLKRQKRQSLVTQNRVMARLKIRKAKVLHKVPMFKNVSPDCIEAIIESTTYEKHKSGDVLCAQGNVGTDFYIIVSGTCTVNVTSGEDGDSMSRRVGTLKDLDFFGESALLEGAQIRNATVVAESQYVQVLTLSRSDFWVLIDSGVLSVQIVKAMKLENERRKLITKTSFSIDTMLQPPPPPPRPPGFV
jgi:hypothetical protein